MKNSINGSILRLLRPYSIIILTTTFSFFAWLFPDIGIGRKGIDYYYSPTVWGILTCASWLVVIISLSYVAYNTGSSLGRSSPSLERRIGLSSKGPYIFLSVIGWIGLLYVILIVIQRSGLQQLLTALSNGQANYIKDTLYSDYSIGLPSLRYIIIPAAALAIYHLMNRRYIMLSIVNVTFLICLSLLSSRLSIMYCLFILLPIIANSRRIKLRRRWVLIGIIVLFLILSALNWSRNRNFYIQYYNQHNWLLAGLSEIITYLGSPFQGFLATGTLGNILYHRTEVDLPHFTGIPFGLNTNSSFNQLVVQAGFLESFVIIAFEVTLAGFICGLCSKNLNNYFGLLYGILVYCFAEQWRVHLFNQGIVITIIVVVTLVSVLFYFSSQTRLRLHRNISLYNELKREEIK